MNLERLVLDLAIAGTAAAVKGMKEIDNIAEGREPEIITELSGKVKEIFANNREKNEPLHYNADI